jgi:ABC-type amino acid transport substrate-binding protein
MKFTHVLLVILLSLGAGFAGAKLAVKPEKMITVSTSTYDRVMKTRTLTCGYAALPPFMAVSVDGKISGPTYDIMNEIGKRLGLKVEWKEETGYGQIAESIQSHRIDAFCGVLWATSVRAAAMQFSRPTHYMPVYPCVAADSTSYDTDASSLNAPDKTFAAYDGDISYQLAAVLFPKAKIMTVPPTTSVAEWLGQVATHKADAVATCEKIFEADFSKNNPGQIKIAAPGKPLTHVQVSFALGRQDDALKSMIDQAMFEMTADGTIERIMRAGLGDQFGEIVLPKAL